MCKKGPILTFRPLKMTFIAIQPNPSYDMLLMSSQRSFVPKKRKSYWGVSEIGPPPPPLKVDAANDDANADDDGLVGIWKAPLPRGTAELKAYISTAIYIFKCTNIIDSSSEIIDMTYMKLAWNLHEILLLVNIFTDMVHTNIHWHVDNNIHWITDTFHVINFGHLQFLHNFERTKFEFLPWKWLVHC